MLTKEDKEKIIQMRKEGLSYDKIHDRLGFAPDTIMKVCKEEELRKIQESEDSQSDGKKVKDGQMSGNFVSFKCLNNDIRKVIDLRSFLKKYMTDHQENQELCGLIRKALEVDRKIREQELEDECVKREEELQRQYMELKKDLEREYETFKKDYINEKDKEYVIYKQRLDEDCQQKVNGLQHSVNVAFDEGIKAGSFVFHCANCRCSYIIKPNSELEVLFHEFLEWLGVVCPDCNYNLGHPYLFWHCRLNCHPPPVKRVGYALY